MNCQHHYVIPSPDGREWLPGVCKRCGAERAFRAGERADAQEFSLERDPAFADTKRFGQRRQTVTA